MYVEATDWMEQSGAIYILTCVRMDRGMNTSKPWQVRIELAGVSVWLGSTY